MRSKLLLSLLGISALGLLSACQSQTPPLGVQAVDNFDIARYQGQWYEIARLDNRFEKGLSQVTASYRPMQDGTVQVINRGFNENKQRWSQSIGKARFTGSPNTAALKVSFFGPFYASYNVIALDNDYQTALVCGPNRDYLWILARQPRLTTTQRDALLKAAEQAGFATDRLLWTPQSVAY